MLSTSLDGHQPDVQTMRRQLEAGGGGEEKKM